LREFAEENGREVKPLTDEALALLRSYSWPGNVRELRTAIEHGVVMCNAAQIGVEHLPEFLRLGTMGKSIVGQAGSKSTENSLASTEDLNLYALEQRCITAALARAAGNRTVAAELLGISRRTLQRKLKEKGL
jgi:DNA-binding NtrC family response regulator